MMKAFQGATAAIVAFLFSVLDGVGQQQIPPKLYSVLATAQGQLNPAQIRLAWPGDAHATGYAVARKTLEANGWTLLASIAGDSTGFTDTTVAPFTTYEYQIIKTTDAHYRGYGYVAAGIQAPLIEDRGKIVLLVAANTAHDLVGELAQLQRDLVGDGWTVLRHEVSPSDPVTSVKAVVQSDYDADPDHVRALLLFGAIPVPYSGAFAADGHSNHFGAWPADVYYGELHGTWTDTSVTSTNGERTRNWNVPGDGKFDQSMPPGEVNLEIGRVDLSNMTCFANKTPARSETDLLRQYLVKDHNFRVGSTRVEPSALICDNFSDKGDDPIAGSGWRNFGGFVNPGAIDEVGWSNYFPSVTEQAYLWTFASGGGQYYTCTGVGSSDDFALSDVHAVFTMWLGSYFGDWDNESNFLRAPLGSSSDVLTSCYAGFPQWLLHSMAMGETIGYGTRLTQNNGANGLYPPFNQGTNHVHIALMGDPTLRLHPFPPPQALEATASSDGVRLSWPASPDPGVIGYHLYRGNSEAGPFTRVTGPQPITELGTSDVPPAGTYWYMVRAIKLQVSPSGSYLNPSQGTFTPRAVSVGAVDATSGLSLRIEVSAGSTLAIHVSGPAGQPFVLEGSPDLLHWRELLNGTLTVDGFDSAEPLPGSGSDLFFRARGP